MAEQRTLNPQVLGSNPRGRTDLYVKIRRTDLKIFENSLCGHQLFNNYFLALQLEAGQSRSCPYFYLD